MDAVLSQLQPRSNLRRGDNDEFAGDDVAAWGSMAGYGNLDRHGGINSMTVPRTPDVSACPCRPI